MLEGIAICALATSVDIAYVFIRGEYHRQAKVLERAIKEAYEHGVFGGNGIFGSGKKLENDGAPIGSRNRHQDRASRTAATNAIQSIENSANPLLITLVSGSYSESSGG